jgi:hypothetical protein
MFSTLVKVALFAPLAIQGVLAFAVNNPVMNQCEETTISWERTDDPYNVIVVAAANPCGDALADLGDFNTTITKWKVTIPAGTVVQVSVVDSKEEEAWSGNITVGAGDSSCLPASSKAAPTSTPTGSSSSSTPSGSSGSSDSNSDGGVGPLGAANAGSNSLFNSATSTQYLSKPVLAVVAFAAMALVL